MLNIKREFDRIYQLVRLFKLKSHYIFKDFHMKLSFKHANMSRQTFKMSD